MRKTTPLSRRLTQVCLGVFVLVLLCGLKLQTPAQSGMIDEFPDPPKPLITEVRFSPTPWWGF